MNARILLLMMSMVLMLSLCMFGCTLSTTIVLEDEYDVRIVNRSGECVEVRWDGGSCRCLDDGCVMYIPADSGCYELELEPASRRGHTRPKQVFKIEVEADIEIVFQEGPDIIIIEG